MRRPTFQEVEVVILALPPASPSPEQIDLLCSSLSAFVTANENPATSSHLKATAPDRMDGLVQLLVRPEIHKSPEACTLVLKAMKILARRQDNRQRCTGLVFQTVVPFCSTKQPPAVASEAANALLNLAYEAPNVALLMRSKGEAALLQLLEKGHEEVLANAAGALQTVCYQREGREAVRRAGGVGVLIKLLAGRGNGLEGKVRQRTVGALHNLSSEADAVRLLREQGGVPVLAALLQQQRGDAGTVAAAVGALQNVSREAASASALAAQPGTVEALIGLLAAEDVQVAACAAGVLLNIHKLHRSRDNATTEAQSLIKGLAGVLAAATIYSSLYKAPPDLLSDAEGNKGREAAA